jgi:uncharacterized protein YndB with AHSA1/START domain
MSRKGNDAGNRSLLFVLRSTSRRSSGRACTRGKEYEDKGEILAVEPGRLLWVIHYRPLSGQPDAPENFQTLTYELEDRGTGTHLSVSRTTMAARKRPTTPEACARCSSTASRRQPTR